MKLKQVKVPNIEKQVDKEEEIRKKETEEEEVLAKNVDDFTYSLK